MAALGDFAFKIGMGDGRDESSSLFVIGKGLKDTAVQKNNTSIPYMAITK